MYRNIVASKAGRNGCESFAVKKVQSWKDSSFCERDRGMGGMKKSFQE
jgi:hypothetical protein